MRSRVVTSIVAVLVGAFAASIVLLGNLSDVRDQRDDLSLFLEATSDGWAEASTEFFRTPAAAARLIESGMGIEDQPLSLHSLLAAVQLDDDIDATFVGYPDGRFLFAARSEDDGFRTRLIPAPGSASAATLVWYDDALNVLSTESEHVTYDPRERPWFKPIQNGAPSSWTDPYVFSSSERPGITYSAEIRSSSGELTGVVGVDVQLTALGQFLNKLKPGSNGVAAVLDADGVHIASSAGMPLPDEDLSALPISERDDSTTVFTLAKNRTGAARSFGPDGAWTLISIASNDDFIEGDDSALTHGLRWMAIALPTALIAAALLLPAIRRLQSIYDGATLDTLTGIPNRASITADLKKALEHTSRPVTVAIVDLDGFKPINDTWGHHQGDLALQEAAKRLQGFADMHGMQVGRLGGDEFLVVAVADASSRADRTWPELVATMATPLEHAPPTIRVSASIGVSDVPPGKDRSDELALRRADRALYEVKRAGGNAWSRHDADA